jgi:hypothetical protein
MNEPATEEMESSKESMRQEASGCPLQTMHTQRTVPDADASHLTCDGVTRCCDVRTLGDSVDLESLAIFDGLPSRNAVTSRLGVGVGV